ncbi:MAG: hypothetical protein HKM07_07485 [Chlamydiae bacterium]|nr:hypothetical protein [Chlamydiota bacterium]
MSSLKGYFSIFRKSAILFLCLFAFHKSYAMESSENEFSKKFFSNLRSSIEFTSNIPQKDQIYQILSTLETEHCALETGSDDLRVKFVHLQGCIEHMLACFQALGDIEELIGVIHTPMPATPVCIQPGGDISDILDESIRYNSDKLLTVRSRAQIVREYLLKGGKLLIAYPQGGLEKRSEAQQKTYLNELAHFSGKLLESVLSTDKIAEEMVGATYLFRNSDKQVFAFSIKSRQANDIRSQDEWGIWFGSIHEKEVQKRINHIFDYLTNNGAPDIRKEILAPSK